jgi:hypothetical protein
MLVILESVGAGIIVSLINKHLLGRNMFEVCMSKQEEDADNESLSISATVSDASTIQHVHV